MTVIVALILTVLTFTFVAIPFFRRRKRYSDSVEYQKLQELYSQRDITYSMLKELEFDFQSGVLTEADYLDLETRYKGKAISILRSINDLGKDTQVEDEIEEQVLGLRRGKDRFCPQCGVTFQESDHFCSSCGTSLNQGEHRD
jgi:hypothetical protein